MNQTFLLFYKTRTLDFLTGDIQQGVTFSNKRELVEFINKLVKKPTFVHGSCKCLTGDLQEIELIPDKG